MVASWSISFMSTGKSLALVPPTLLVALAIVIAVLFNEIDDEITQTILSKSSTVDIPSPQAMFGAIKGHPCIGNAKE